MLVFDPAQVTQTLSIRILKSLYSLYLADFYIIALTILLKCSGSESSLRKRISTVDLPVLSSSDKLLLALKKYFFCTKQAILMLEDNTLQYFSMGSLVLATHPFNKKHRLVPSAIYIFQIIFFFLFGHLSFLGMVRSNK
jgi:hypothetical protein